MRTVHFVGSIPDPDPVGRVVREMGARVRWLPAPESANWIVEELEHRATLPALRTLKRLNYRGNPRYHPGPNSAVYLPRRGQPFPTKQINAGYVERAVAAATRVASAAHEAGVTYPLAHSPVVQVGVPGPADLGWCSWGPLLPRYYRFEVESLLREVHAIHELLAGAVVFQLEIPLETCGVAMAPMRRAKVAAFMAKHVCRFLGEMPASSRWIIHLCLGDPNGRPVVDLHRLTPLVTLGNALIDAWPSGTYSTFEGIHMPIPVNNSAFTDVAFHRDLAQLDLPEDTELIAGVARVGGRASGPSQLSAVECIEAAVNRSVVVSSPCGWSRRPDQVPALFDRMRELAGV